MSGYVGSIDQGTTSTRFIVVDEHSEIVAVAQKEHRQILPGPGLVEHDADEVLANTEAVIAEALTGLGLAPSDLAGVGITNQRETTVVWDRATGQPVHHAIVWQDTRTAEVCRTIASEVGDGFIRRTTGLPVATYFSGPKVRWLLDHDPGLRRRAETGELAFGTMDTWLAWHLTGRHVTDVTNASRTMLMDLETLQWDPVLCDAIGIPMSMLPEIVPSIGDIAPCRGVMEGTHLRAILGDQHAAMVGQAAFGTGDAKCTYGTGAFLLTNTGTQPVASSAGLITTVAYQRAGHPAKYALEGSVAVAGSAVQWLRDNLGFFSSAAEIEPLARSVADNGDTFFVPAFSGLFAPHWRPDARGVFTGLTRYTTKAHMARAVLEATAFQVRDLIEAMRNDTGSALTELRVDGGMVANTLLMQTQADVLDMDVVVPSVIETTALGAAYGAGMDAGLWEGPDDIARQWSEDRRYTSMIDDHERRVLLDGWDKALERSLGWAASEPSVL
ncbi:MAG: glycerol kinase GlpK [Acidimicrobiia bacterium]|nr:glycerol kinase GlpK [Acidimicrobiia bacterium]